jgi:hypothetical protein
MSRIARRFFSTPSPCDIDQTHTRDTAIAPYSASSGHSHHGFKVLAPTVAVLLFAGMARNAPQNVSQPRAATKALNELMGRDFPNVLAARAA